MNLRLPTPLAGAAAPLPCPDKAARLFRAAETILPAFAAGRRLAAPTLREIMEDAFGGSDAEGAWAWKDAYEACEAALVLFLRRYGPAMRRQANEPARLLAMIARVADLAPSETRRSDESQSLQQFSTPIPLGFVAAVAASVAAGDVVLEPSAGTGLLAIHGEQEGATLALNELAKNTRRSSRTSVSGSPRHPA